MLRAFQPLALRLLIGSVAINTVLVGVVLLLASCASAAATNAIVIRDQTPLRNAPRDSAQQQAVLWEGEVVEVRGERLDYLQVWDYHRERGGFVKASQVRRVTSKPTEAPELLSVVRFVRDTPGSEALGIGFVAAFIQAAPAEVVNGEAGIEALDALGTMADRLARRASSGAALSKPAQAAVSAHLEVAGRYGIKFTSFEHEGHVRICYEGDASRRVLAMKSNAEQRARAALALTRPACVNPDLSPGERRRVNEWRAEVLDRVDTAALPGYLRNRVHLRRAGVWSSLAFEHARNGETNGPAATRPLKEIAGVEKRELTDEDLNLYADAAMRVSASRWAAVPAAPTPSRKLAISTTPGQPGETCIALTDEKLDAKNPLAKRCTYAVVWASSVSVNREGTALALAVQPTPTWRELWVFRKSGSEWTLSIVPPAATNPEVGYVEFAGWVPGGNRMLAVREARSEGKYKRSFEILRLDTLTAERQAADPTMIASFQRWQDPSWKRQTLSIR